MKNWRVVAVISALSFLPYLIGFATYNIFYVQGWQIQTLDVFDTWFFGFVIGAIAASAVGLAVIIIYSMFEESFQELQNNEHE